MVFLIASFSAVLFPLDVLDETWDVIESVSEGFLTHSLVIHMTVFVEQWHKKRGNNLPFLWIIMKKTA